MSEPKPSKTRGAGLLVAGLILAMWDLSERPQRPEDPQLDFYVTLYIVAFAVLQLARAPREAQWGMNGAFLVVFLGTLLRDLVLALVYKSSVVWIVAATMLAMALLGLYWFRSARPWPASRGDGGA
jgi:hypothetical protein